MKVRNADSSAIATANGASHFRRGQPFGRSASDGSNVGAVVVSALVIPARWWAEGSPPTSELMQSYHNVAELRQFHGVPAAKCV